MGIRKTALAALALICGHSTAMGQEPETPAISSTDINGGPILWKDFQKGMTVEQTSAILGKLLTIKKFKVRDKPRVWLNSPQLPSNLVDPFDVTNFMDQSKMTSALGVPVTFELGFGQDLKLSTIVISPQINVSGDYQVIGLGCRGYPTGGFAEGRKFWELALATKYPERREISEGVSAFSDSRITVQLQFRRSAASKRLTEQEKKANPVAAVLEAYKCYIDTYVPQLVYTDNTTFEAIQLRNKQNLQQKVDNFIGRANADL